MFQDFTDGPNPATVGMWLVLSIGLHPSQLMQSGLSPSTVWGLESHDLWGTTVCCYLQIPGFLRCRTLSIHSMVFRKPKDKSADVAGWVMGESHALAWSLASGAPANHSSGGGVMASSRERGTHVETT